MKKIFFLVSSKHEFFEFLYIRKHIDKSHKISLLIEDNLRTTDIDLGILDSNTESIFLPNIYYSKRIFSNILKYKNLLKKLNFLKIKKNDKFIFFYGGTLLYFLVLKYFKNKGIETVMFLTSWFYIKKGSGRLNLLQNIWINMLSYFILFKRIKVLNYKNTIYWNHRINYKIDYVICFRNDIDELLNFKKCFHISNFFHDLEVKNLKKVKYLLILSSYWESVFKDYNKSILLLINEIGLKNLLIKDHPTSPLNNSQIKLKYGLNDENILPKKISLEKFLITNRSNIKSVIGPTSAALKYSSFFGIQTICYSNLFMFEKEYKDYSKEYFLHNSIHMINNVSEIKKIDNKKNISIKREEINLTDVFKEYIL